MRSTGEARPTAPKRPRSNGPRKNRVGVLRERQLLTKAELARMAGISPLTLARIEAGSACRVDTKRKILLALGLEASRAAEVFGERRPGGRSPGERARERGPSSRSRKAR